MEEIDRVLGSAFVVESSAADEEEGEEAEGCEADYTAYDTSYNCARVG